MDIIITNRSGQPIYEQIFEQIAAQIATGKLPGGTALPPIRTIAAELEISVITIKKAWEELDRAGLIDTVTGKGCFVADINSKDLAKIKEELAKKKFEESIGFFRSLSFSAQELSEKILEWYE